MDVTWDRVNDMGYIRLSAGVWSGLVSESIELGDQEASSAGTRIGSLTLDFDRKGRLVGIEVANAKDALHPTLLETARLIT